MEIKTNNQWREFIYWNNLTEKEQLEFDYMDTEEQENATFLRYRNWVYSLDCFMRINKDSPFPKWDGYYSDSFFSGVLIKLSDDDSSMYKIATYYS